MFLGMVPLSNRTRASVRGGCRGRAGLADRLHVPRLAAGGFGAAGLGACAVLAATTVARAADEVPLRDIAAVAAACDEALADGPRRIYVLEVPAGAWRFGSMALDSGPDFVSAPASPPPNGGAVVGADGASSSFFAVGAPGVSPGVFPGAASGPATAGAAREGAAREGAAREGAARARTPTPSATPSAEATQTLSPVPEADADVGTLFVDTRTNLRALGGRVALMPAGLEPIGFRVTRARGRQLEAARRDGAILRVGFFLGQDDRDRTLCIVRPAGGQTLVRAEVAFAEIVRPDGSVVAREDTERLRALEDDDAPQSIPGAGPRARIDAPYALRGAAPDAWRQALVAAGQPGAPVARALAACHAEGVGRGAAEHSRVVVRLVVTRAGAVRRAEVELSDNGDEAEAQCVARAIGAVSLPALGAAAWGQTAATAPSGGSDGEIVLSVPVRLTGAPAAPQRPTAPPRQ
jgi:hypothetical protein